MTNNSPPPPFTGGRYEDDFSTKTYPFLCPGGLYVFRPAPVFGPATKKITFQTCKADGELLFCVWLPSEAVVMFLKSNSGEIVYFLYGEQILGCRRSLWDQCFEFLPNEKLRV